MEVAENVVKEAKEGGILSFGGNQVSEVEKDAFAQIAVALGTTNNLV